MSWVLKRVSGPKKGWVARRGHWEGYTLRLKFARFYETLEAAQKDATNGIEIPESVADAQRGLDENSAR